MYREPTFQAFARTDGDGDIEADEGKRASMLH